MRTKLFIFFILAAIAGVGGFVFFRNNPDSPAIKMPDVTVLNPSGKDTPKTPPPNEQFNILDPTSITFIANKHHPLPANYVPSDLIVPDVPLRLSADAEQMQIRAVLEQDLVAMITAATQANVSLHLGSGYRSAAYQKQLYEGYVAASGQAYADATSARPGHSEHQTGLAIDFTRPDGQCSLEACFGQTQEGLWLANNAVDYGFVLRYPLNKEGTTGYIYEPWHYRYVGREAAKAFKASGHQTLEDFFGLEVAPDYKP